MKTKMITFSLLSLPVLAMMFVSSAHAMTVHIDADDLDSGWKTFKDSKLVESAGGLFSEVWSEFRMFVANGLQDLQKQSLNVQETSAQLPKADPVLHFSPGKEKKYFSDIDFDPNKGAIRLLASYNIINTKAKKFYPHNHVRLHEVVKMLLKSIEAKGQKISHENTSNLPAKFPKHYLIADSLGLLEGIPNKNNFERLVNAGDYQILLNNTAILYSALLKNKQSLAWNTITRSEMAKIMVDMFGFTQSSYNHVDTNILASQGMYPFGGTIKGEVSRLGFAQFLTQVYATKRGDILTTAMGNSMYTDVDYAKNPYMYYAQNEGLINYLTVTQRGTTYFYPDQLMTKHEVYHILGEVFNHPFEYVVAIEDKKTIKYDELSSLFVQVLAHEKQKKVESKNVNENDDFVGNFLGLFEIEVD